MSQIRNRRSRSPNGRPNRRSRSPNRSPNGRPNRRSRSPNRRPNDYIYCGNNRLYRHPDQNIDVIFGTNYRCLKKGFGSGFHSQEVDLSILNPYQAIDNRKIYCGSSENLPNGYDRVGNSADCFQKGFAIGKIKRAREHPV
jgi:hypothetical protein